MHFTAWIMMFLAEVRGTPLLEWIAIFFAVAEVLLAKSNKVLLYPAGIISTAIYMWLFVRPGTKLYADAILNSYYLVMSIYGWILWGKKDNGRQELQISFSTKKEWIVVGIFVFAGWAALYLLLTRVFVYVFPSYVPSDAAVWDAFVSATAWVGMWQLTKRKIENWILLNISNLAAVPLYMYKGMPFTACLTVFLFIVAIFGYIEWRNIYRASAIVS